MKSRQCRKFESGLIDFIDDRIDAEEREFWARHSADCAACQQLVERAKQWLGKSEAQSPVALPDSIWHSLQARINAEHESRHRNWWCQLITRPAIAVSLQIAGLVLAVGVGLFLGHQPTAAAVNDDLNVIEQYATISSAGNEWQYYEALDDDAASGEQR